MTAEHCSDDGALDYHAPDDTEYEVTYVYGRDDDYGDFGWHTTGEVEDNQIYSDYNTLRNITSYEDDFDELLVGQFICKFGQVSGRSCDNIRVLREDLNEVLMEETMRKTETVEVLGTGSARPTGCTRGKAFRGDIETSGVLWPSLRIPLP